jgi:hypothetical protein
MNRVRRTGSLVLAMLTVSVSTSFAQVTRFGPAALLQPQYEKEERVPPAWGTASESVITILASDINPPKGSSAYTTDFSLASGIGVYATDGDDSLWWTGVRLPSGALITKISMEACDSTATGEVTFGLGSVVKPAGTVTPLASGTTGISATPGCAEFTQTLASPVTVNNFANSYVIPVSWSGATAFGGLVKLYAIRVYYKLQVSPAPGVATFADVPVGHPLHRFVEALVAAGITGGCGGGNYCPDGPLTRGQMAVFLAAALGLHFPN